MVRGELLRLKGGRPRPGPVPGTRELCAAQTRAFGIGLAGRFQPALGIRKLRECNRSFMTYGNNRNRHQSVVNDTRCGGLRLGVPRPAFEPGDLTKTAPVSLGAAESSLQKCSDQPPASALSTACPPRQITFMSSSSTP